jgi:hypothetical protein
MSFDPLHSAQVAHGKFHLHPWEGQVLVDRDVLIRSFFREMRVVGRRREPADPGFGKSRYYTQDEFSQYFEIMAISYIGLLTVIYVLLLIAGLIQAW